ncbi:MAG: aldo/keto reductase [Thaumarchaeota archaeon]|nr:aldo/keto reductase [Nitrososphaerota archaeon]
MRLKEFGRSGRLVSEVGMGTYYDPPWIATATLGWRRGGRKKVDAIRSGLEAGINLVDTAEIYGSEPLVAEAIRGRKRDELFIATKAWSNHLRRDALLRSFEKSLRRLGTGYIDLYQIHRPNGSVPIEETMGAMEELIRQGRLMYVGVSNFSLRRLEAANAALNRSQLASVQLDYSLVHRNVEREILPYCDREKIALMAYYPLGHGRLASDRRLDGAATKSGKTRNQVALRWLADRANVFPIPRASGSRHVLENIGASGWQLAEGEADDLEKRFS